VVAAARYRSYGAEARSFGITSVQLIGDSLPVADSAARLVEVDSPIRWKLYRFPMREAGQETTESRPHLPPQPSARVDVRGMKWILDGTPVERLAATRAPYADAPTERGRLNFTADRLREFVRWGYATEDPLLVHAIGDAAIDAYLTAMEQNGAREIWRQKRPRIEHGDVMSADLLERVATLGVVVVQNPSHFQFRDMYRQRFGPDRSQWLLPMKTLLDHHVPLAIGSDGPMNPFLNILWASTHAANPAEALTREQAVEAYTLGSAFAEFTEHDKGQLTVGKLADFAVLSDDVFTAPADRVAQIRSVLTVLGGRIVHDTGAVH
jgi:predicted amidohydrolase YtcJ